MLNVVLKAPALQKHTSQVSVLPAENPGLHLTRLGDQSAAQHPEVPGV